MPSSWGVVLEVVAQRAQRALAAVPDGDDEVRAGEAHHLAGLHHLAGGGQFGVLDVVDGLEDGEERVVVALQLGPLVGVDSVLHGQRVQAELPGDARELLLRGLVQADPGEAALAADTPHGLGGADVVAGPLAVAVDGAVHDGAVGGRGAGGVVAAALDGHAAQGGAYGGTQITDHRHGWLLHGLSRQRGTRGATLPETQTCGCVQPGRGYVRTSGGASCGS
ncbi:hypothetical protein GCM10020000_28060 [Streptomyces olivoverticillatus]